MSPCLRLSACVVVLALGCAGAAGAQPFSGVVVFGDSLSDSGNLAVALDLPVGLSLTTNPDPVAAEIVADALGRPVLASLAGGTNFAWIGACVNPAGPCLGSTPSTAAQIAQHLSTTGGHAAPGALYSLSGGANDVIAAVARGAAGAATDAAAAGAAYVRQVGRLQDAGAGYVVVYNLPDLGAVPAFAALPAAPALSAATGLFNDALAAGLGTLGGGVIPIDVFGLFNELRAEPGRYDLTNVTGAACAPPAALPCGPAGAGLPGAYAPGANAGWLFADGLHPTGVGHAMLAEVVLSTLAAPVAVSLAGEGGVRLADNHGMAVHRELLSDLQFGSTERDLRGYVTVQYGEQGFALDSVIEAALARVVTVTLGANHRVGERLLWGGALTLGTHGNEAAAVQLDTRGAVGSLHAALGFGGGYVHGAVSGGVTDVAIGRDIRLGQPAGLPGFFAAFAGGAGDASAGGVTLGRAVRTETGSVNVRQLGTEAGAGWMFGAAGRAAPRSLRGRVVAAAGHPGLRGGARHVDLHALLGLRARVAGRPRGVPDHGRAGRLRGRHPSVRPGRLQRGGRGRRHSRHRRIQPPAGSLHDAGLRSAGRVLERGRRRARGHGRPHQRGRCLHRLLQRAARRALQLQRGRRHRLLRFCRQDGASPRTPGVRLRGPLRPAPLPPRRAVRSFLQTGLRPAPPASACGGPFAPRRYRRGALCAASFRRGFAPHPRRPLAGAPSPRAATAEARCARLRRLRRRFISDGASPRTSGVRPTRRGCASRGAAPAGASRWG